MHRHGSGNHHHHHHHNNHNRPGPLAGLAAVAAGTTQVVHEVADIHNQEKIHCLIAECKDLLINQTNLNLALNKLEAANNIAHDIHPANIEPERYTPPTYFSESLEILRRENSNANRNAWIESQLIASRLVDQVMQTYDKNRGVDALYAKHKDDAQHAVSQALQNNWHKFYNRDPRLPIELERELLDKLKINIKPIGWIRWFEDRSKTSSLKSQHNAYTGVKEFPVLALLKNTIDCYQPVSKVQLGFSLPIFPETIPVARTLSSPPTVLVAETVDDEPKQASAPPKSTGLIMT